MKRLSLALFVLLMAAAMFAVTAQDADKPHVPDYGKALQRNDQIVEINFLARDGKPVVLDGNAGYAHAYIRRMDTEHCWSPEFALDRERARVGDGVGGLPRFERGEYELHAWVGFYGLVRARFTVGEKPYRVNLVVPHDRKVVKIRFMDDNGDPLEMVRTPPKFEQKGQRGAVRDLSMPEPVLRLPPEREQGRGGMGGFAHRRARIYYQTADGWFYATVFSGEGAKLIIPLGKEYFGKDSVEIDSPFGKDEHEVQVTPTDAWRNIDRTEFSVHNKDDPGLKKRNEIVRPNPADWRPKHRVKLELTPTVATWARYAQVFSTDEVDRPARYVSGAVEMLEDPGELSSVILRSQIKTHRPMYLLDEENFARWMRTYGERLPYVRIRVEPDGGPSGVFMRVVAADGTPTPVVEVSPIPIEEDQLATAMRKLETDLAAKGERPPAPETFDLQRQNALRAAVDKNKGYNAAGLKEAMGDEIHDALQKKEYRDRYALYGAWYNSHWRMDGDEDGYVMSGYVNLEKDKLYALYIWGKSRDDLNPDMRVVVRGQGEATDLGVIRLPK